MNSFFHLADPLRLIYVARQKYFVGIQQTCCINLRFFWLLLQDFEKSWICAIDNFYGFLTESSECLHFRSAFYFFLEKRKRLFWIASSYTILERSPALYLYCNVEAVPSFVLNRSVSSSRGPLVLAARLYPTVFSFSTVTVFYMSSFHLRRRVI